MKSRKSLIGMLILFSMFTTMIIQRTDAKKQKKTTVKIGSYITPNSVWGKAINQTISNVKKRTKGEIAIKHMHSGMLGSNQNMLEQVLLGGIHGAGVDTSAIATIVPEMNILELPFLFRDRDEAYYLLDNVITPHLKKKLDDKGLITSAIMEIGFMDFVMAGPIHTPADLKKMKIGSWESPVHIAFWKSLGANPIPIPATEVFSSYARGMVDSGANSPSAIMSWDKLFGAGLKRDKIYITRIDFTYHAGILIMNKDYYNTKLSNENREIFREELSEMMMKIREDLRADEPKAWEELEKMGYNIVDITSEEKQVFVNKSAVIYDEFRDEIGSEFLDRVLSERAKYREQLAGKAQ